MTGTKEMGVKAWMDVGDERMNQDAKWGQQNHEWPMWLTILTEELGEASQEFLKWQGVCAECGTAFNDVDLSCDTCTLVKETESGGTAELFREELVQVVAVGMAALQAHDRNYP